MTQPESDRPRVRVTREDLGSWLSGPGAVVPAEQRYRGERLGLPESGPGSVAGFGRRLAAVVVDWLASLLLVRLFLPGIAYGTPASSLATMGFFLAELTLFTWLVGASFGQRLLGIAVVRLDGGAPGPARAFLRSVQVCLLVPAVVWDRDGRGLHDRSVGTVVVRR
ncbi:MAG TPA: RDD family protein [Candidatus Angelobacter sp.]|nr:RDD family protein [Candidatus Angelobacter sp.]